MADRRRNPFLCTSTTIIRQAVSEDCCNNSLGDLDDDPALLQSALRYVARPTEDDRHLVLARLAQVTRP